MKLFCTVIILSTLSFTAITSPVKTHEVFSVQNNFSNSSTANNAIGKKNTIRLYPNPSPDGTITVNSTTNDFLNFYVFDLEGTLLHRITLKGKEHKTIKNLKTGTYMYDVFKNDESIEQGKITVK
jgi:hypothetical protein